MSTKSKVPANNDTPIFPIDHTLIAHNVSNQFKTPVKLGLEIGACMTDKDTNGIKKTACVIDKTADIAITQGVRMTARGNIAVGVPLIAGGLAAKVIVNEQTYKRDNHTFFDRTLLLTYEKKMQFYEEHKFDTDDLGALKYTEPELPKSSASRCEVTNTVTVRSLLELINGPAPISGAIYIATTNHLDELKEICPALFRTGRLTPIYFGYFENETLQEVSRFYYDRELNLPNNVISTVCSAEILDFITKHKLTPYYKFMDFENYIIKNIKQKPANAIVLK